MLCYRILFISFKTLIMKMQLFFFAAAFFAVRVCTVQAQTNTHVGFQALLSNTSGTYNTATGFWALRSNTTGTSNSAHGAQALFRNTTGGQNTASGRFALYSNTSGGNNTASGVNALYINTTGANNTATGSGALYSNATGFQNTASGNGALSSNTSGINNTASGFYALHDNTTGDYNTASGYEALASNTTGDYNTANGGRALYYNATGQNNTASGYEALFNNAYGVSNTASGYRALRSNTYGNGNTATGVDALRSNTTGNNNTATGVEALRHNTSGNNNTAGGYQALYYNGTGSNNTALGLLAGDLYNPSNSTFIGAISFANTDVSNSTALGYNAIVTASNQVRVGNSAVTSIGGQVDWTTLSDGRYKKNVKEDVPGLAFITKLRPVTYTLDVSGIDSKLKANRLQLQDEAAKIMDAVQPSAEERKAKEEKARVKYTGFVAQEVEQVAKKLNYEFSGVDAPKNDKDFYGLRYAEFVVPLVKAVQELSQENAELKTRLDKLEAAVFQSPSANITLGASARLEQNIPNPFISATTITYSLPSKFTSAQIIITDKNGKHLKQLNVSGSGNGTLQVDASILSSGTYHYSLVIDGKIISTKQMVVAK